VIPDLPGYGWSAAPESNLSTAKDDAERLRSPYAKRNMAKAMVDFSMHQSVYESALRSAARVLQPSLLDFLG